MTETKATPGELLSAHILNIWQEQDPTNTKLINTLAGNLGYCPTELMQEILENHDDGSLQDVIYGFRIDGGEATNIQQFDEFEFRAVKLQGKWVGWRYLYGAGKHSNPESWPWIENSFFLDLVEEKEVTRIERKFEYIKD